MMPPMRLPARDPNRLARAEADFTRGAIPAAAAVLDSPAIPAVDLPTARRLTLLRANLALVADRPGEVLAILETAHDLPAVATLPLWAAAHFLLGQSGTAEYELGEALARLDPASHLPEIISLLVARGTLRADWGEPFTAEADLAEAWRLAGILNLHGVQAGIALAWADRCLRDGATDQAAALLELIPAASRRAAHAVTALVRRRIALLRGADAGENPADLPLDTIHQVRLLLDSARYTADRARRRTIIERIAESPWPSLAGWVGFDLGILRARDLIMARDGAAALRLLKRLGRSCSSGLRASRALDRSLATWEAQRSIGDHAAALKTATRAIVTLERARTGFPGGWRADSLSARHADFLKAAIDYAAACGAGRLAFEFTQSYSARLLLRESGGGPAHRLKHWLESQKNTVSPILPSNSYWALAGALPTLQAKPLTWPRARRLLASITAGSHDRSGH